jgi:hypothetical protein
MMALWDPLGENRRMSAPTPTEFIAVEGNYAPEAAGLFFGVEPTMLFCALATLLAVGALAYVLGARRSSEGRGFDEATDTIHARILKASRAALSADSTQLKHKAEELAALFGTLLGPVIKVGTGVGGPMKLLDEALKGKIKVEQTPDHTPPHQDMPGTYTGSDGYGGGAGGGAASSVTIIGLPFLVAGRGDHPTPAEPAHSTSPGEIRDMTVEEQTDALARAVRKFNDHWSRSDARRTELREARKALSH